jgi:uncharacterized protein (TIGR03435 family)
MFKAGATLAFAFLLPVGGTVIAQQAAPTFEVASVKPNRSGGESFSAQTLPNRTVYTNYKLINLVAVAHQVRAENVLNAPEWVATERFDINAKLAESDTRGTPTEVRVRRQAMLQNLLRDRFRLVVREESVEKDSFALVVARSDGRLGAQLRPSALTCGDNVMPPPLPLPEVRPGQSVLPPAIKSECRISETEPGRITGRGQPLSSLAVFLLGVEGRTVVDKTGLQGRYDFELSFTPTDPLVTAISDDARSNRSSVLAAIQEQLGLKLQPDKVSQRAIHIERIERPTPD